MGKLIAIFCGGLCFITLSVLFFCFSLSSKESAKERALKNVKK